MEQTETLDCLFVLNIANNGYNRQTIKVKTKCVKVKDEYIVKYKGKVYKTPFVMSYYDEKDNKKYIVIEKVDWGD